MPAIWYHAHAAAHAAGALTQPTFAAGGSTGGAGATVDASTGSRGAGATVARGVWVGPAGSRVQCGQLPIITHRVHSQKALPRFKARQLPRGARRGGRGGGRAGGGSCHDAGWCSGGGRWIWESPLAAGLIYRRPRSPFCSGNCQVRQFRELSGATVPGSRAYQVRRTAYKLLD